MTEAPKPTWLTIPDLVDTLGIGVSKVRRLIEDKSLAAVRKEGVWMVPELFVRDGEALGELKGTLIVLGDAGFSNDEAVYWLLDENDALGVSPIEALRSGRKAEVRRVAQALG